MMRAGMHERVEPTGAAGSAPVACAPEAGLVARARGGDAQAFGALYEAHGAAVHAVLLARVPRADADDLTQEVFVTAWRRLGELRDDGAIAAWLLAIARRRAIDWSRERGRRGARDREAAREHGVPGDEGARADGVLEVVRGLPERYREALLMRLVAGLNGRQIAARLGMTEGSVRVCLHRGMRLLRERLAEESG